MLPNKAFWKLPIHSTHLFIHNQRDRDENCTTETMWMRKGRRWRRRNRTWSKAPLQNRWFTVILLLSFMSHQIVEIIITNENKSCALDASLFVPSSSFPSLPPPPPPFPQALQSRPYLEYGTACSSSCAVFVTGNNISGLGLEEEKSFPTMLMMIVWGPNERYI